MANYNEGYVSGNTIIHSDGSTSHISDDGSIQHPDGSISTISGNTIHHPDGSVSNTYDSNYKRY